MNHRSSPAAASNPHRSAPTRPKSGRFPSVVITAEQLDGFHDAAHTQLTQTIREFTRLDGQSVDAARWRCLKSKGKLSVFADKRPGVQLASLLVAGTMPAHLTDVMEGLSMDNSYETRRTLRNIHARFIDAEVLGAVEHRSPDHPFAFTGFKWALLRSSSSGIVSNRDLCYFEKRGILEIGSRQLGYLIMQSVDLSECPPSASRKVVRADISLCYVFEELRDGLVGVYMKGTMESRGPKLLWKVARNNFADIVVSIGNAVELAFANRYTRLANVKRAHGQSSPRPRSIACDVCDVVPSVFDHHYECAGCRKNVCKKCRRRREMFERADKSERLVATPFCTDCIDTVRALTKATWLASKPDANHGAPKVDAKHEFSLPERDSKDYSIDSNGVRFSDMKFESYRDSFSTETEYASSEDPIMDSQRSLRQFSLKLTKEFANLSYDDADPALRLSDLESLGVGDLRKYIAGDGDGDSVIDESESDEAADSWFERPRATSGASSTFSVADEEYDDDQAGLYYNTKEIPEEREIVDEDIVSIQPVRRSTQPPEMLERQVLNRDGTVRNRPVVRPSPESSPKHPQDRSLLARLVEVSIATERTLQFTSEQSRRAKRLFSIGESRRAAGECR